ncbi:MAG: BREX system ATP-binding domain-containing protein [Dehalococcoidia bacterium]
MTFSIEPQTWLKFLDEEYLATFIKEGGASVKFAVPLNDSSRSALIASLSERAANCGYAVAHVDAEQTRVQMIDQIFFAVAEQMPWNDLSLRVLARLASEAGFTPAASGDGRFITRLAEANRTEEGTIRLELRPAMERGIFKHRKLSKDFRVAMMHLSQAELSGGEDGLTKSEVITDWLTGRNKAISAVKPYSIFTSINRANARHLLESLLVWVRFAGMAGLLILLDTKRVSLARNPRDEAVFYSRAAVMDHYEVLRQFIDATDRMRGCLVVVIPAQEFLDDDPSGRGLGAYQALKFRVFDEVHDRALVNPMASLVRLADPDEST